MKQKYKNIELEKKISDLQRMVCDNMMYSAANINILGEKIKDLEKINIDLNNSVYDLKYKFDNLAKFNCDTLNKIYSLEEELTNPSFSTLNNMKLETIEKFIRTKKLLNINETNHKI